jgi:hypothetical protein
MENRIVSMSKVTYDEILGGPLSTINFKLQMADLTLWKPEGVAKDVLAKIRDAYIPTDFIILDMGHKQRVPPILGRPFLNTTNAVLYVGLGHVSFYMQGQTMRCPFNGFNKNKQPKTQPQSSVSRYGRQRGQHPHLLLRTRMNLQQARIGRRRVLLNGL